MPISPVNYIPRPYVSDGRIGDLLRRRGDMAAQALLRGGEIQAQMWGRLGQIGQGAVNDYVTEKREAPIRADEARLRGLRLQEAERTAAEPGRLAAQDQALGDAIVQALDAPGEVDPRPFVSIAGPKRGMDVATGLHEFRKLTKGPVESPFQSAGRIGAAMKALPPSLQARLWPQAQQALRGAGLTDIPDTFTPDMADFLIAYGSGKAPEKKAPIALDPTKDYVHPDTLEIVRSGTPEIKRQKVTVQGPNGPMDKLVTEDELMQGVPTYRAPSSTPAEPLVAIMGDDGAPVLVPRREAVGRRPASTREQGRAVTSGDAGRLAELDTSMDDLKVLRETVLPVDPKTGKPVEFKTTGAQAKAGAMLWNPITEATGMGADAKSRQAVIDRVKQVIGKALEGGVLRKEDEYKYEKILPTIGDVASVVKTKLEGLDTAIKLRRDRQIDALEDAGYDVSKFRSRGQAGGNKVGRFTLEVEP